MRLPPHGRTVAIVSACAMLLAWLNDSRLSAQDAVPPPRFALHVPNPPTIANGESGAFLVYELLVTNFVAQQWTLQKIEVLSGTPKPRVLHTLADRELGSAIARPGTTIPADQRRVFAGGAWGVVMLWVPVDRGAPPASLSHRLTLAFNGDAPAARELQGGEVTVRRETVTIGPPLRGGLWLVTGFTNESGHRRSMFGYGAGAIINARFAIDYLKVGEDDRMFSGDRQRNENHHAYGQEALAVADGVVVASRDGIADNIPLSRLGPPNTDNIETFVGNHVFLEIGPRLYALYAHLKPGSLRVATGHRVKRGQVIGLVGNTGNSAGPHLHFQLSEDAGMKSDGLPYAHEAFEVVGRCKQTGARRLDQTCAHVPPEMHRGEIPLQGMLIRFPEESTKAQEAARAVSPRNAVERAIPLLQASARTWSRERRCASCHHQGLGPIAMAMARERGFRVDESMLRAQLGVVRASLASADASANLPANYLDESLWLAAMGSVGDPSGRSTDLAVHRLLSGQHVDGHWIPYLLRPPIEGSLIQDTAWAIRALRLFAPTLREKEVDAAISRAREWMVKQTTADTQDLAMKLLALRWSGTRTDRIVQETARRLVALQRADGGWSQTSARGSDAYATGQALVALNQAADMRPTDAAFAKGVAFLTRSQHADGSWLVETRRTWRRGIPYFESGFPHGKHQFISYAGAAWATMALVLADRHEQSVALMGEVAKNAAAAPLAATAEGDVQISNSLTPLMRAALFGSVEDMRTVLKERPDVNATATTSAITALMCAAHDAAKVRLLIDAGANVRAATLAGHTALLVAAGYAGAAESVRVLLQHGADPNARTRAFLGTPLVSATLHGDRMVVALLLDAGAVVNDRPEGSMALSVAAHQGDEGLVALLLDRGANIESHPQANVAITNGEQLPTPLMRAADRQHIAIVKLLLARGANANARDRQGMTPLMYAAGGIQTAANSTPVIEALIAAKADIDARAANGDTALRLAERYGNEAVIAALKAAQRPTP